MRTTWTLLLAVALTACAGDEAPTDENPNDTSYSGMRVRKHDAGWRVHTEKAQPELDQRH